jgi:hypothetical protein
MFRSSTDFGGRGRGEPAFELLPVDLIATHRFEQLRERNVLAGGNGRIENQALHLKLVLAVQALGRVFVKAEVDLQLDCLARWDDADVRSHAVSLGAGGLDLVRNKIFVARIL